MTTAARTSTGTGVGGTSPDRTPARPTPPEWLIETFIKRIGVLTGALGRRLDRAAMVPLLGWVVRRLTSVWLGIILLLLIGAYIAVGSGFPELRAHFEMTDLQFFDAWPMRVLLALLAVDLSFVTLRKIPLTLFKLGSWTVHVGILTLIAGCVWYFSMKEEGQTRIYLNKPATAWYDVTERALYAFPVQADGTFNAEHATITPMPTLPIYEERLDDAEHHNPLDLWLTGAVPGPAGGGRAADVHVSGYYPDADLRVTCYREAEGPEAALGPAVGIAFNTPRETISEQWLESDTPADRLQELAFRQPATAISVELLVHPTAERLRELQTSFDGQAALLVRVPKAHVERTYVLKTGDPIPIEGTAYTLTPTDDSVIPMLSKGYEGTQSTTLTVNVSRKDGDKTFEFERNCVSRYPERSPDFVDENGKHVRKQDGVDRDIEIVFLDARHTQAWIVEGDDGKLSAIVRGEDGKSVTTPVTDAAIDFPVKAIPGLKMRVLGHTEKSVAILTPVIVPKEQRTVGQTVMDIIEHSAIDLDVMLPGGGKLTNVHVPFGKYGDPAGPEGVKPTVVNIPGMGPVGLMMSTVKRALPTAVTLVDFKPVKFPGAVRSYADYVSSLKFADSGTVRVSHLNRPVYDGGLIYFQAFWDGDPNASPEKRFSVMGVANRPGMMVMITGAICRDWDRVCVFYAKPLLLKAKKASLVAWAAHTKGRRTRRPAKG